MKRWICLVVWAILFVAATLLYLFSNQTGTRALLAVTVAIPLLSAAALYLPRQTITAFLETPETVKRNEPSSLRLTVRHPSRFPAVLCGTLRCKNRLTGQTETFPFSLRLGSGKDAVFEANLTASHCGLIEIELASCELEDALGLFFRKNTAHAAGQLLVRPNAHRLTVRLIESADYLEDSQNYSAQRPGFDPSEIFRIREYRPGDPIRQIHWKLSEKTQTVFVRDFGLPVVEQLLLLQELTAVPGVEIAPEDLDLTLDALYSVSKALLRTEIRHMIAWQDNRTGEMVQQSIDCDEALEVAFSQLLGSPQSSGYSTVAGCFSNNERSCTFAHTAVFSTYSAPDLERLYHGNIVTALLPVRQLPDRTSPVLGVRFHALPEEDAELEL